MTVALKSVFVVLFLQSLVGQNSKNAKSKCKQLLDNHLNPLLVQRKMDRKIQAKPTPYFSVNSKNTNMIPSFSIMKEETAKKDILLLYYFLFFSFNFLTSTVTRTLKIQILISN
uniref:Uncharacterized protein n=1 Tax=Opuntia streptacantha TaxID=393608 RepID=A0A7C9DR46_OPUST